MAHAFITVAIPFAAQRLKRVDAVLASLAVPEQGNRPRPAIAQVLDDIGIVHYMSIVTVGPDCPAARSEDPRDRDTTDSAIAHLMIEITADGGVAEALAILARTLGAEFERILAVAEVRHDSVPLAEFLRRHHRPIGAGWTAPALGQTFSGSPGMSVWRIRRERDLAAWIGRKIDEHRKGPAWRDMAPRQRLDLVRRDLWTLNDTTLGDTKWAFVEEPAPCLPGDPANPWDDSGYTIRNRQALKALGWILHTLLWPLYVPLALAWLCFSAPAWDSGWTFGAVVWPLAVFGGLMAILALGVAFVFARLRRQERRDPVDDRVPPSDQVAELMKQENHAPGAQNHMATISRLKPGWLRQLTLRIAFVVVGSGRFVCAPGFLGKNGVIHSARWIRLPGTTQLLFWSNFDNTWESYVADFIADAPSGVTAIWSNCRGFPRTKRLFGGGAEDRDRLVHWARRQQKPTLFWYSAYPDLTTARIRNNAAIRQGLASAESDADARDWLALFGSAPRPADGLDLTEIPTLVFGGLSNRPCASCLIVQLNGDANAARAWLGLVARDATFGEASPGGETVVAVALAASGLRKLGVPDDALGTFPTAFQQGMWPEWRARELGDVDANRPEQWLWGGNGGDRRGDALVLIYAADEEVLKTKAQEFEDAARTNGHAVRTTIPLKDPALKKRRDGNFELPKELFGFADGVSQPVIRGAPRRRSRAVASDMLAPGEIVLGYPDDIGTIPPSPSISARHDPRHCLPDRGPDPFRRRPEFSRYECTTGERDLGANGTFLVVRQLDQDKAAFDAWLKDASRSILKMTDVAVTTDGTATSVVERGLPGAASADVTDAQQADFRNWLAARLVGRWQDGSSLVRNAKFPATLQSPTARPDNAFLFGAEDPRGLSCPLGSHVRRANPRDTRFHGTPDESNVEVAAVNRHRILRVGRGYGYHAGDGDAKEWHEGLLFMCLNSDIERQFEFIQKTWLLNRNIHGLENEIDPIVGCGKRDFTIPLPNGPLRLRIDRDFVRVVGGGYFFLPSRAALHFLAGGARAVAGEPLEEAP